MTLHELLDLLVRWVHLIAGIMWIGNSMLFNWLDRNLEKAPERANEPGYEGKMWMVHSGGFYEVEKKQLAPGQLPARLHWFKWQNFTTWASGIGLLVIVYYLHDAAFLIDPAVRALSPVHAVSLSVATLVGAWVLYDLLWRTLGPKAPTAATVLSIVALAAVTFALTQVFSGRAAYLHVGVLLGTIMTGNVWFVIVPSQRKLVAATESGQEQDYALNQKAKQRSIHNNYMTFPLLFVMLSNHFPSTYGHPLNWLVLYVLMVGGAGVRHFMNIRFRYGTVAPWLLPLLGIAAASLVALVLLTRRPAEAAAPVITAPTPKVAFSEVRRIVDARCRSCHSSTPTEAMFPAPPNGVVFDTDEQVQRMAARIKERVVVNRTMPFVNKTGMEEAERTLIGRWVDEGATAP